MKINISFNQSFFSLYLRDEKTSIFFFSFSMMYVLSMSVLTLFFGFFFSYTKQLLIGSPSVSVTFLFTVIVSCLVEINRIAINEIANNFVVNFIDFMISRFSVIYIPPSMIYNNLLSPDRFYWLF